MGNREIKRVKRTQRDYPLTFKLSVVEQIEKGEMTYRQAQKIKRLEKELENEKLKNFIYREMVGLAHREYGIVM